MKCITKISGQKKCPKIEISYHSFKDGKCKDCGLEIEGKLIKELEEEEKKTTD